jgi:hypothetical protein
MNHEHLFRTLRDFNWDDDLSEVAPALQSPDCALECAVLAFWRLEGPWHYIGELPIHEHAGLVRDLAARILKGDLRTAGIAYDPTQDQQLSKVQVRKLLQAGLPEVFLRTFRADPTPVIE